MLLVTDGIIIIRPPVIKPENHPASRVLIYPQCFSVSFQRFSILNRSEAFQTEFTFLYQIWASTVESSEKKEIKSEATHKLRGQSNIRLEKLIDKLKQMFALHI